MDAFPPGADDFAVVLFFLSQYESLGKFPLQLLREGFDTSVLVNSAASMREHGRGEQPRDMQAERRTSLQRNLHSFDPLADFSSGYAGPFRLMYQCQPKSARGS